jgi:hypothetical protein
VPFLFDLAPGGVCHAAAVTSRAVRSYRTVSPLPCQDMAVYFLWHFPSGHPGRALPGTVPRWSPDFPPACRYPHAGGRPTLWRLRLNRLRSVWEGGAPKGSPGIRRRSLRQAVRAETAAETREPQPLGP